MRCNKKNEWIVVVDRDMGMKWIEMKIGGKIKESIRIRINRLGKILRKEERLIGIKRLKKDMIMDLSNEKEKEKDLKRGKIWSKEGKKGKFI